MNLIKWLQVVCQNTHPQAERRCLNPRQFYKNFKRSSSLYKSHSILPDCISSGGARNFKRLCLFWNKINCTSGTVSFRSSQREGKPLTGVNESSEAQSVKNVAVLNYTLIDKFYRIDMKNVHGIKKTWMITANISIFQRKLHRKSMEKSNDMQLQLLA